VLSVGCQQITLRFWDTPGDRRFIEQNKLSYQSADYDVVVYDIVPNEQNTSFDCVKSLIKCYWSEVQSLAAFVVVSANKYDFVDQTHQTVDLNRLNNPLKQMD
jgi:GTPase SAR1 family protein